MESSWWMRVLVYLCIPRGCSDRAEHLKIAGDHCSIKYDHFVMPTYKSLFFIHVILTST